MAFTKEEIDNMVKAALAMEGRQSGYAQRIWDTMAEADHKHDSPEERAKWEAKKAEKQEKRLGDAMIKTELAIGLDVPSNAEFRTAWKARDDASQERIHATWLSYRWLHLPYFKPEKGRTSEHIFHEARLRCAHPDLFVSFARRPGGTHQMLDGTSERYRAAWAALDEEEQALVVFLVADDLLKDIGRYNEEQRAARQTRRLNFKHARRPAKSK